MRAPRPEAKSPTPAQVAFGAEHSSKLFPADRPFGLEYRRAAQTPACCVPARRRLPRGCSRASRAPSMRSFTLEDAVEDCPEYLVQFPTLQKLAREVGLEACGRTPRAVGRGPLSAPASAPGGACSSAAGEGLEKLLQVCAGQPQSGEPSQRAVAPVLGGAQHRGVRRRAEGFDPHL